MLWHQKAGCRQSLNNEPWGDPLLSYMIFSDAFAVFLWWRPFAHRKIIQHSWSTLTKEPEVRTQLWYGLLVLNYLLSSEVCDDRSLDVLSIHVKQNLKINNTSCKEEGGTIIMQQKITGATYLLMLIFLACTSSHSVSTLETELFWTILREQTSIFRRQQQLANIHMLKKQNRGSRPKGSG